MDIRCTVLEMQCALASYIISVWSYIISWQRWIWTIRRFHSPFDFLWNRCVFEGQDCQWAGIQWKSEIPVLQCAVLRDSVMMVLLYISGPWPVHQPMRKQNGLYWPMRVVEIHAPPIHQWSVAALSELTSWIHNRGHQAAATSPLSMMRRGQMFAQVQFQMYKHIYQKANTKKYTPNSDNEEKNPNFDEYKYYPNCQ